MIGDGLDTETAELLLSRFGVVDATVARDDLLDAHFEAVRRVSRYQERAETLLTSKGALP